MDSKTETKEVLENATLDLSGELTTLTEPTSPGKKGIMALALTNPVAREWLKTRRQNIRPWLQFFDTKKFRVPVSFAHSTKRVMRNVEHFQSNYLFVFLGLLLYCILTSPLLIVAIFASLGACYIMKLKNDQGKLKILGYQFSLGQQYAVVALISFPLFYISGAGSAVFWVLGVSFFIIMLHATLHASEPSAEEDFFELQMEPV